jgi:hypothetical protein
MGVITQFELRVCTPGGGLLQFDGRCLWAPGGLVESQVCRVKLEVVLLESDLDVFGVALRKCSLEESFPAQVLDYGMGWIRCCWIFESNAGRGK